MFEFAPNTLKLGWNVSVSTGSTQLNNNDDCGQHKRRFLSPTVRLEVTDTHGDPVKHFEAPLNISTFAHPFTDSEDGVCFAYNQADEDDEWKCNNDFEARSTRTKNVAWVKTSSYHLTSFAVLLGSASDLSCHGLDWISIASLSMIAAAICFGLICILLYWRSVAFRAFVGGYDRQKKMSAIQNNITKQQHQLQQLQQL